MGRIKDFFLRDKTPEETPRERVANAIEDLLNQLDEAHVVRVAHNNIGPLGGESSQINLVYTDEESGETHWMTVNIYGGGRE